jgi:hypothetical protein
MLQTPIIPFTDPRRKLNFSKVIKKRTGSPYPVFVVLKCNPPSSMVLRKSQSLAAKTKQKKEEKNNSKPHHPQR